MVANLRNYLKSKLDCITSKKRRFQEYPKTKIEIMICYLHLIRVRKMPSCTRGLHCLSSQE